jgi:hypothetical protein
VQNSSCLWIPPHSGHFPKYLLILGEVFLGGIVFRIMPYDSICPIGSESYASLLRSKGLMDSFEALAGRDGLNETQFPLPLLGRPEEFVPVPSLIVSKPSL